MFKVYILNTWGREIGYFNVTSSSEEDALKQAKSKLGEKYFYKVEVVK